VRQIFVCEVVAIASHRWIDSRCDFFRESYPEIPGLFSGVTLSGRIEWRRLGAARSQIVELSNDIPDDDVWSSVAKSHSLLEVCDFIVDKSRKGVCTGERSLSSCWSSDSLVDRGVTITLLPSADIRADVPKLCPADAKADVGLEIVSENSICDARGVSRECERINLPDLL
jgi:hypothetical protein